MGVFKVNHIVLMEHLTGLMSCHGHDNGFGYTEVSIGRGLTDVQTSAIQVKGAFFVKVKHGFFNGCLGYVLDNAGR